MLKEKKALPNDSSVLTLSPFLDEHRILRVGGRLKHSHLPREERFPILIPGRSHIALLLVRHYHEAVYHQGRHLTEGSVRASGFWIVGGRRLITNMIYKCVVVWIYFPPAPPFTGIVVDVFVPGVLLHVVPEEVLLHQNVGL